MQLQLMLHKTRLRRPTLSPREFLEIVARTRITKRGRLVSSERAQKTLIAAITLSPISSANFLACSLVLCNQTIIQLINNKTIPESRRAARPFPNRSTMCGLARPLSGPVMAIRCASSILAFQIQQMTREKIRVHNRVIIMGQTASKTSILEVFQCLLPNSSWFRAMTRKKRKK